MFYHLGIGIAVLALTGIALIWKLTHPRPPLDPGLAAWERILSKVVHAAFWALLLVIPLTGWLYMSTEDDVSSVPFFGLFDLPLLPVEPSDALHDSAEESHELLGKLMGILVILHAAAALKHHFIDRDSTLSRMLPFLRRRG